MDLMPIVVVGAVATAYMSAVSLAAERLRYVKGTMLQAIGAFLIPEPMRSTVALSVGLHFFAGVAFTVVYAYIFGFVMPAALADFVAVGVLFGLVHGFFTSYFMMLGFSALAPTDGERPFTFKAAALNVVAHMVFGAMVGLGLGYASLSGAVLWFAVYSLAALIACGVLAMLLVPPARRFQPRREALTGRGL